jgi:hypothetical protein
MIGPLILLPSSAGEVSASSRTEGSWIKLFWTVGVYGRLNGVSEPITPGAEFGKVWVRSLIGLYL